MIDKNLMKSAMLLTGMAAATDFLSPDPYGLRRTVRKGMEGYDQYGRIDQPLDLLYDRAMNSDNPFGTIRRGLKKKVSADPEKKKQRKAQGKARQNQRRHKK